MRDPIASIGKFEAEVDDALDHFETRAVARDAVEKRDDPPTHRVRRSAVRTETVREIRRRAAAGEKQTEIAKSTGISTSAVGRIVNGDSHWWVR